VVLDARERELSLQEAWFPKAESAGKMNKLSGGERGEMLYDEGQRRLEEDGSIVLGIILGVVLVPVAVMGWFRFGHPPVAVAIRRCRWRNRSRVFRFMRASTARW
jgi:hypothetical protein